MFNRNDIKVFLITLGCSKNLIDAECMITRIREDGYFLTDDINLASTVVINTCGFIEDAKKEAIDTILDVIELKNSGIVKHIIVTGCLAQRYSEEIIQEFPEVDIFIGTNHFASIVEALDSLYFSSSHTKSYISSLGGLDHLLTNRDISTTSYAWLKIGEGCVHNCTFCAIPLIRGRFKSRPIEDILDEARSIVSKGYKEIILAAQDTTNYGIDLYKRRELPRLLNELCKIDGLELIRVMYGYMDGITDELIDTISNNSKIANYLDIPIQHASSSILKGMGRHETTEMIEDRINHLRAKIPNLIIRTTVMVGFPGENEEDFNLLLDKISKWEFDRLGCFAFSPEEGTKAYDMEQTVSYSEKQNRLNKVYELQREISYKSNLKRLNSVTTVTIDSISEDGIFYIGRSYGEAPEVDPVIYVIASTGELEIGSRYEIRIVESKEYEMTGVTI